MTDLNPNASQYANKLRLRVCGICIQDDKLLLVQHEGTVGNKALWMPPGGGVNYGESLEESLRREFLEETGLTIDVGRFLFVNEFMQNPLHAIEFFFEVKINEGELRTGTDPEHTNEKQLIEEVKWLSIKEIIAIPLQDKHRALQLLISLDDLLGHDHYFIRS